MDSTIPSRRKITILRLSLSFAFIEGMFALWAYLTAPSEAESVVFLQYSALRLMLLLVVFLSLLAILFFLAATFRSNWRVGNFVARHWNREESFWILLAIAGLTFFLIFASKQKLDAFASYRERLYPMLAWFALVAFQFMVAFIYLRGIDSGVLRVYRETLLPARVAVLLLALLAAFIAFTKIGLAPDTIYWQGAGVPLLFSQVIVAFSAAVLFNVLAVRVGESNHGRLNLFAGIILWALAVFLWWSQPARASYNILEPAPPNFQEYPFGDAILYDTAAHEFLMGTALPNDFWVKPLYSFFLAALHLLAGENYALLVFLQIAILAVIPVLVYSLVSLLGNRAAGVLAGLLVILREQNSIALSNVIQVSHLKLLLSDVFSMGLVVLLVWLVLRWFERPDERRVDPLMIGGVLGLLTLTRGHPILLFPILAVVIFLFKSASSRQRWGRAGLFAAGVALVLIPWLWRIYETTGRVGLQSPVSPYSANMAGLYSLTPRLANPAAFTTEVSEQTLAQSDAQNRQVLEFALQQPGEVARFVSAHFFHNTIFSYIYLPHSFRIESLRAYVTAEPFWGAWFGELSFQGWALLGINFALLALGFGAAWNKRKAIALVPLLIGVGYTASVSIGRISGWRFILPSDWITLVYYSIGLVQLSHIVGFIVNRAPQDVSSQTESQTMKKAPASWMRAACFAIFFLSIGAAVTYGNLLFSTRYPAQSEDQLAQEYLRMTQAFDRSIGENDVNAVLQDSRAKLAHGQAIYPYYLEAGSGPVNHFWPAYKPRPYSRLVFYLVGSEAMNVILPISSSDFNFPGGAEVMVLGCVNDFGDVEALAVLLVGESTSLFMREPIPEMACPFPESN
jgi:hypothetical protein